MLVFQTKILPGKAKIVLTQITKEDLQISYTLIGPGQPMLMKLNSISYTKTAYVLFGLATCKRLTPNHVSWSCLSIFVNCMPQISLCGSQHRHCARPQFSQFAPFMMHHSGNLLRTGSPVRTTERASGASRMKRDGA